MKFCRNRIWPGSSFVKFIVRLCSIFLFFLVACGPRCWAGGGPETTLLVVNSGDIGSKTIANYYVQIRKIPAANVIYLDPKTWNGSTTRIDIETFREKIIRPILNEVKSRSLEVQTEAIIYSSGFPWAVDYSGDLPTALRNSQLFQYPQGSLSGLTYLVYPVMAKLPLEYTSFTANHYMRLRDEWKGSTYEIPVIADGPQKGLILPSPSTGPKEIAPPADQTSVGSHGFRGWYGWGPKGELSEAGGNRYVLSAVLGVTDGRGNSVQDIIRCLQRSATADGTFPTGTVYFMDSNTEIRTTTRKPGFRLAMELLRQLGVKAEIVPGVLPQNRPDVQGLMTGYADFNWPASGSTIRPGAICENFTSFGAVFDPNAGQTPLSVFLQYGAAGSSGTVAEPYAYQNKFPYSLIQVHYARGCSLAEAFYQAVYAPFQLLIVGDPLCQPWANIPQVEVSSVAPGDTLTGNVTLQPTAKLPRDGTVDRFELYLDGIRLATTNAQEPFQLDTTKSSDGYHELRIVGIENSVIESQGRIVLPVQFNNYGKTIQFSASPEQRVRAGGSIKLTAKAPGVRGVTFFQYDQSHPVAKFSGSEGEATVDTDQLGEGPVTLQAMGWGEGGFDTHVYSKPITLSIEGNGIRAGSETKNLSRKAKFGQ
jgi:hypothetical protein